MAKAVQKGLFGKKGLSVQTSVHMAGEQNQAKYHLNRSEAPVEKPHNALSSSQFVSQLGHPLRESLQPRQTQLPMFMSAKEIGKHYQVLDGDREENYTWNKDPVYGTYHGAETDRQVLRRKYREANEYGAAGSSGDRDYIPGATPRSQLSTDAHAFNEHYDAYDDSGPSLADSVREHGVEKPLHLEAPKWGAQYDGTMGKPQIFGGHHRYAVMREDRPNDLIPVAFHESFWGARDDKDYR